MIKLMDKYQGFNERKLFSTLALIKRKSSLGKLKNILPMARSHNKSPFSSCLRYILVEIIRSLTFLMNVTSI